MDYVTMATGIDQMVREENRFQGPYSLELQDYVIQMYKAYKTLTFMRANGLLRDAEKISLYECAKKAISAIDRSKVSLCSLDDLDASLPS